MAKIHTLGVENFKAPGHTVESKADLNQGSTPHAIVASIDRHAAVLSYLRGTRFAKAAPHVILIGEPQAAHRAVINAVGVPIHIVSDEQSAVAKLNELLPKVKKGKTAK